MPPSWPTPLSLGSLQFPHRADLVHHQEVLYGFPIGEDHVSCVLHSLRQDLLHLLGNDTWGGTCEVWGRGLPQHRKLRRALGLGRAKFWGRENLIQVSLGQEAPTDKCSQGRSSRAQCTGSPGLPIGVDSWE